MANVPSSISAHSSTVNIYTVLTESSTAIAGTDVAFVGVSCGTDGFEIGVVVYFFIKEVLVLALCYLTTFLGILLGVLTAVEPFLLINLAFFVYKVFDVKEP